MGRTLAPYSMQIEAIEERLKKFRRGLRREDQTALDSIMRAARYQLQSGVLAASPNPFDSVALSALIDQERRLCAYQSEIEDLRNQLQVLGKEFSVVRSMAV
ncbi:MAG: hypothetical protein NXI24_15785 [bacterium]|nr:hypothetical protein [bacterium]